MGHPVPIIDDISLAELQADPYPAYARLRKTAPVAWVTAANINLVGVGDYPQLDKRQARRYLS